MQWGWLGIWVKNRGGKRELKLRAGAGFRVFVGLGCGIRKGNRAGYGISMVWWKINWPAQKPQVGRSEPLLRIAVSGFIQVMKSNGSVSCQVLSWNHRRSGGHYPEPLSSILILWVNPVPCLFVLESPPTGVFAGVFMIANHRRAVVLYCYTLHAGHTKVFHW